MEGRDRPNTLLVGVGVGWVGGVGGVGGGVGGGGGGVGGGGGGGGGRCTVLMFKIEGQAFFEAFILLRRSQFTTVSYDNW